MAFINNDFATVKGGEIHFFPSGSSTVGVSQSFDSTTQHYVVTMSGASLSQSYLAPINDTGSYFYLKQSNNNVHKIYYTSHTESNNIFTSSIEPVSGTLPTLSDGVNITGSAIPIFLKYNATGSDIFQATIDTLNNTNRIRGGFTISSSDNMYLHIQTKGTGTPPADDLGLVISGSSFSYSVVSSGSGIPGQLATLGTLSTSSIITAGLDASSEKFHISAPVTAESASFSYINLANDGFYGIIPSNPLTGSTISMHGGLPADLGYGLPNPSYIKTAGGFDILLDSANVYDNSEFRVWKNAGVGEVSPAELLLKVTDNGDLTTSGSILGGTF